MPEEQKTDVSAEHKKPHQSLDVPIAQPPAGGEPNRKKWLVASISGVAILLLLSGVWFWHYHQKQPVNAQSSGVSSKSGQSQTRAQAQPVQGLQLDSNKNYGNKYADGIVPVGDGKYQSSGAKTGYIYACQGYAKNLGTDAGGAGKRGPWFTDNNTEYNINEKIHVQGSVMWQADFSNTVNGDTRTIVTNDLPSHPTGVFPIRPDDPAYVYDRNPNSIKGQTFTFNLSADPTYSDTPTCEGGEVGVMLTGIALFSGLDAGGRDAGAWEVQDNCDGHPQSDGIYHYHTLSSCIKSVGVNTVIGYALDGFPITGPQVGPDNILTTSDLDECHGITSQIVLDDKTVTMYHYVMTQDYPYSVSCYRGTPIQPPSMKQQPDNNP